MVSGAVLLGLGCLVWVVACGDSRSFWLVWCDFFVGLRLVVAGCVLVWVVLLAFLLGVGFGGLCGIGDFLGDFSWWVGII